MNENVLVTDDAGVRLITIARPEKKNALTQAVYADAGHEGLDRRRQAGRPRTHPQCQRRVR
jgi:enoyl-CoA hydratase/carnithine racemase